MEKKGYLIISLDFELIWGVFDVVEMKSKQEYFANTVKVIPEILSLFRTNNIHATWATVGMLFNKNWEEWDKNIPVKIPKYSNEKLSPYKFGRDADRSLKSENFFASDLIQQINNTSNQEIGTHTYSHYYCLEDGQNRAQFEKDLDQAIELAFNVGIELKSLVFPRNQLKSEYLKICKSKGIINVRSNPSDWYWNDPTSESFKVKLYRTGDAYLNLGAKSYSITNLKVSNDLPLAQPASRFLRPVETQGFLRKLKIKRIKNEMTMAAIKGEIYHLWWHPHNFGDNSRQSLRDLEEIISHYTMLSTKYNFESLNMEELGAVVINNT